MESTQHFSGGFSSQLHQLNGNHFYGPVSISTPDQKEGGNLTPVQVDSRRKFAERSCEQINGGPESNLSEDLSWDSCLQSLAFEGSRHGEEVINRHIDGSCEWLLKSPPYLRWVGEHGLLLIRGNPGCGKSTLLKFALGKQLEAAASTGSLVLSFFFYASGTELQNGIVGLIRRLLLQLFEQDVSSKSSFHEICRKRWTVEGKTNASLKWHQNELQATFERLVLECSNRRKCTIFVDAIDECRDQDRDRLISFFHKLKGTAQVKLNRPRVCFTCRLYPDGQIDADFRIRLEHENEHDIQNFIEQELRLPDETESAMNKLKEILRNKADGLFLWLVLVIQQVHDMSSKGLNLKFIESEILKSPQELDGLYEDLLKNIEDRELLEAGILFQWICFAGRPLSLSELRTAMTVHLSGTKCSLDEYEDENNPNYITNDRKMKKRVIHLSRGLADITNSESPEGNPLVGFYHETIKTFMLTKGLRYLNSRLTKSRGLAETAHLQLANTCVQYLSTKEIEISFSERQISFPTRFRFLNYATTYWLSHAINAEKDGSGNFGSEFDALPREGTTLMHIAAEHGLERLAKSICTTTRQDVHKCSETKSRLHRIVISKSQTRGGNAPKNDRGQNRDVVSSALRKQQQRSQRSRMLKEDCTSGSTQQATRHAQKPGSQAEQRPRKGTATAIQEDWSSITNARNKKRESPLHLAARFGSLGMVRFLHEHNCVVAMVNEDGCTALFIASSNGHLEVVKFLYEHGGDADIHTAMNDGWTPINAASLNGHIDVVKFLYKHGGDADTHTATTDGWTPIYAASSSGHLEVVKFLYEHGGDVDIHTVTKHGSTPIYAASSNGHLEVVKFLYKHGGDADIHTATNDGWTPINAASSNGHLEVVKFLYEHGGDADIHIATRHGLTPIYAASLNGHLEVVKFLYEHGGEADIHTAMNNGLTPIYTASLNGHLEVVKFLYEHGGDTDIHTVTNNGWTPLHAASSNGHVEVVKFLYERGGDTDIHSTTNDGLTPIYAASLNGHLKVAKFLYEHGGDADIHTATNDGWTPLHGASSNGHLDVAKFLYEHGGDIDIHIATKHGLTPIHAASLNGHLEVLKFLYEHGGDRDIHTATNDGMTSIYAASLNGHLAVAKFLYEHGGDADIHTAMNDGWTPIHAASLNGHLEVVKFLYEHGGDADTYIATNDGWTPLHAACYSGHLGVVEFLLEMGITTTIASEHVKPTEVLNKHDILNRTPLHLALHGDHEHVLKCLLEYNADASLADCYGRCAADWALIFDSTSRTLGICNNDLHPTSTEEQVEVLCRTVQLICQKNIQSVSPCLFYELGRCLIYLDDVPSALRVFEQCTTDGDVITHWACCSSCNDDTNIRGQRFVCKLCPNIDLCTLCFARYEEGTAIKRCRGHEFLRIPTSNNTSMTPSGSPVVRMANDERDYWLRTLLVRYQVPT